MNEALLLTLTWIIPFATALVSMGLGRPEQDSKLKFVNLGGSFINLLLVIFLCAHYYPLAVNADGLLFSQSFVWFEKLNINYQMGVDGISLLMMLLTAIVIFCGVLASWALNNQAREFFILLQVLVAGVFGVFVSFDIFTFFVFYEIAVLPMFLLIGLWGTGPKEYAAMKLTLMLVAGSALILTGMLGLYFESRALTGTGTFNLTELSKMHFPMSFQLWAFPMLFLGFGVLGALFPFHTWSPDGHASAPTAVSMLHAGVLMKLGGYGCLRVAMFVLPEGCQAWMPAFLILSTMNVVYGAFGALRQTDLKYVTAYSSVSHCGLVIFGLSAMTVTGFQGAVLQMISHGLMTALFFCLIGMIYGRTHTRIMSEMGGLLKVIPFLGVAFIIAGFAGLGLPGLSGFVAEFTIFKGAFQNPDPLNRICTVLAILSIVVTAVYVLRAANRMLTGPLNPHFANLKPASLVEKIPVSILLFCLFAVGIYPHWIADMVARSVLPVFLNVAR